jgi:hypothetical protein
MKARFFTITTFKPDLLAAPGRLQRLACRPYSLVIGVSVRVLYLYGSEIMKISPNLSVSFIVYRRCYSALFAEMSFAAGDKVNESRFASAMKLSQFPSVIWFFLVMTLCIWRVLAAMRLLQSRTACLMLKPSSAPQKEHLFWSVDGSR